MTKNPEEIDAGTKVNTEYYAAVLGLVLWPLGIQEEKLHFS